MKKDKVPEAKTCINCGRTGIPDNDLDPWTCPQCREKRKKRGLNPNAGGVKAQPVSEEESVKKGNVVVRGAKAVGHGAKVVAVDVPVKVVDTVIVKPVDAVIVKPAKWVGRKITGKDKKKNDE